MFSCDKTNIYRKVSIVITLFCSPFCISRITYYLMISLQYMHLVKLNDTLLNLLHISFYGHMIKFSAVRKLGKEHGPCRISGAIQVRLSVGEVPPSTNDIGIARSSSPGKIWRSLYMCNNPKYFNELVRMRSHRF